MNSQDILHAAALSAAASRGEIQANPKLKHVGLTWCPTWSNIPCKCVQLSNTSDRYFRYLRMATHLPHIYTAQLTVLLQEINITPHWVTLHVFWSQTLCPLTSRSISVSLSHTHSLNQIIFCPISCSWSAYNRLPAVRFTVTASENLCSFTQSKGLKARSAQFILHW